MVMKNLAHNITIKLLLLFVTLILFPIILLFLSHISYLPWLSPKAFNIESINYGNKCNIFRGKWVSTSNGRPYYTNATCRLIIPQQNCMKFGRPDTEFLKWRWMPDECDLPLFDALQFLEVVRGKSMAFVGDSVGRNQMESLLCLLATVVYPTDVSYTTDPKFKRWLYDDYNFTLASFWSPYLVKAMDAEPNGPIYDRQMNVYLDEANPEWAAEIEAFDYVILSAGRWFFGPQTFYENGQVVGCYKCPKENNMKKKKLSMFYGYRKAFRTAFTTLQRLENFKGLTFLRTLSPQHFENGEWNNGGSCVRTGPVLKKEMKLAEADSKLYLTQVEELIRAAQREGKNNFKKEKRVLRFKLIDTTEAMVMRPDGHPNHYGHSPDENVTMADCVHWCLPGPIDTWNEFLLQMLKMEN